MNELYHYGVPGMKWGVRRATKQSSAVTSAKQAKKAASKAYNKAYNKARSYSGRHLISQYVIQKNKVKSDNLWQDVINKAADLDKANKDYKKQAYKAIKKIEKQQYKDFVKKRSKEIKAGESAVGKIYDTLTDAHKYQARIEYGMKK